MQNQVQVNENTASRLPCLETVSRQYFTAVVLGVVVFVSVLVLRADVLLLVSLLLLLPSPSLRFYLTFHDALSQTWEVSRNCVVSRQHFHCLDPSRYWRLMSWSWSHHRLVTSTPRYLVHAHLWRPVARPVPSDRELFPDFPSAPHRTPINVAHKSLHVATVR